MAVRTVTNDDVKKYSAMVEKFLRDSVIRNWNEATLQKGHDNVSLGNTGMSIADFRQYLYTEVVVALQKYNPAYRTKEGQPVKESTFVFSHLSNRIGQSLKRLTKRRCGYAMWSIPLEDALKERYRED